MNRVIHLNRCGISRRFSSATFKLQQQQQKQQQKAEKILAIVEETENDSKALNVKTKKGFKNLDYRESFANRHIGINKADELKMLAQLGLKSLDELTKQIVPADILMDRELNLNEPPMTESEFLAYAKHVAAKNQLFRTFLGMGYYNCNTPSVIQRNIFENPGWITQYTPYQAELAQGRLESLLNFQTMICDLTGLDISNASLLDESTAAAEAMTLCMRASAASSNNKPRNLFLISNRVHPQTIDLVRSRAEPLNIHVEVCHLNEMNFATKDVAGFLFQYPDTEGSIEASLETVVKNAKANGTIAVCATDLLALCLIKSPADIGAEVAIGSAQRFGIPLGYGGPHAAFFSVSEKYKRFVPGRIVGVSRDSNGKSALRLSLQTREQHIRQEKSTSNICTAQALLANMAAFYAIYHGPDGLKKKAMHTHNHTLALAEGLSRSNNHVVNKVFFDTIKVKPKQSVNYIRTKALVMNINLRYYDDGQHVGISLDDTVTSKDLNDLFQLFDCYETFETIVESTDILALGNNITNLSNVRRETPYLTHSVFHEHQSETLLTRYMKRLENKDVSLVHSMIPLGSCTMKLNATTELMPCSWPEFNALHPFVPKEQALGYHELFNELASYLCEITGYDRISFQPNSGAQGEYAGLRAIMKYLDSLGQSNRKVCLIPTSAHGTNAASAAMAGMHIQKLNVLKNGHVDPKHFADLVKKYQKDLACVMITYPSTYGIFESTIREICEISHDHGAQVYMDGANLNAQVGLCRPGDFGSDVSHLNLHKTFCIPHGGGGPGMGPIGVKKHLAPFLPSHAIVEIDGVNRAQSFGSCSAAPYGSASILPISWAYIKMMGKNLRRATQVAILNANYMMKRLEKAYHVNFVGKNGYCAHEFIINADFKSTANVEATDIAKRLQDYGFHSATVSWPVHGALMIEPTESESKQELDRFCDALLSIRQEIAKIEQGVWDKCDNPIKNAPHTQEICISSKWNRPYDRETAAFPINYLKPESKIWPTIGRVDDTYGDKNLVIRRF